MNKLTEKNKIFSALCVLIIMCSATANAQRAEFGLRFMPTFSSFDVKTSSGGTVKGEAKFGFGFGGFLGFNFNKHVGIQGEVIYSTASQKYTELDVERKIKLKYVNIPLLVSLNTGKTNPVNLNIVAGPQMGISVGSSLKTSGGDGSPLPNALLSVKKGDIGFAYGAGVDFGLNEERNIRLGLGYRGVLGLFDISDNNKNATGDSYYLLDRSHIKSNAAYIGLSILF
ncbi:MAG: porin family protein [Saprospiraceae bacterium]|nr:PorT family protein [Saprospiraceae bacterium]